MTDTPGPSERQPRETPPAYAAFRIYLEQGPGRSTERVRQHTGKDKRLIERWCSRWRWVDRVREFEGMALADVDDEHLETIKRRARRQAETAAMHIEATSLVAREVLKRVNEQTLDLADLTVGQLLQLEASLARSHTRAVHTERLALGMTTDQPGEAMPQDEARQLAAKLSDEDLDASLLGVDELAKKRAEKAQKKRRAS